MLFFFEKIAEFNKEFPDLLSNDVEGIEEDDEEQGNEREDDRSGEESVTDAEFIFSWMHLIDEVSELTHEPWSKVWEMHIYEFFNTVCYGRWKSKRIKEAQERWKRTH